MKSLQQMDRTELTHALKTATRRADQLWEMGKPNEEIEKVLAWEYRLQMALGIFDR